MAGERQSQVATQTDEEYAEDNTFCWRIQPLDARDMATIIELDPDIIPGAGARTAAIRAALRDYARRLRKRGPRAVA